MQRRCVHAGAGPCMRCLSWKTVSKPAALLPPRRVHAGQKPFKCHKCEKVFSPGRSLAWHRKILSEGTPRECSGYQKTLGSSSRAYPSVTWARTEHGGDPSSLVWCFSSAEGAGRINNPGPVQSSPLPSYTSCCRVSRLGEKARVAFKGSNSPSHAPSCRFPQMSTRWSERLWSQQV